MCSSLQQHIDMATDHGYSLAHASVTANGTTPENFKEFDDVICQFMRDQGIPGISVAISYHGNTIYSQGYGKAGVNRPVTPSSKFRVASISKPLTSIGILRLVDQGYIKLEDKVFGPKGILKEFQRRCKGDIRVHHITVRHLLQHSAGWDRDRAGDPVFYNLDYIDAKDGYVSGVSDSFNAKLVRYMMSQKLQFTPGKRHAYSNLGYLVLGLVIERVSGLRYEMYMNRVLTSMGLPQIHVGFTKRLLCHEDEVEYFNNREPKTEKSIFPNEEQVLPQYGSFSIENTGAYGGWVASASDILAVVHALQHARNQTKVNESHCKESNPAELNTQELHRHLNHEEVAVINDTKIKTEIDNVQLSPITTPVLRVSEQIAIPSKECVVIQESDLSFSDEDSDSDDEEFDDILPMKGAPETYLELLLNECRGSPLYTEIQWSSSGLPVLNIHYALPKNTLHASAEEQSPGSCSVCKRCILKCSTVSEMFRRPTYEDGNQWYGLGLDVQDSGESFSHSGAMEGSCGTLMSHKSGLSWVLLMNSWSRDMDLDGLVKYALSTVRGYPLYFDTRGKRVFDIVSNDEQQMVLLQVPHSALRNEIQKAQETGFELTYINACTVQMEVFFNLIFQRSHVNWGIHIDVDSSDISNIINNEKTRSCHPCFLESYVHGDQICHCVIFKENVEDTDEYQVVDPVSAKDFVKRYINTGSSSQMLCQSVVIFHEEIFVSALLCIDGKDRAPWLQISAEDFLVEQKRQLKKGRDLSYVKFFSRGDDTFVSATWTETSTPSDRLQRYGASKYGLLQELRESSAKNMALQACSCYVLEGVINFAAIWKPE